ncbi:MAG TPA: FkbM family methyltransferase [Lentisphaeria bacterium]|nr:MAG: hypothetical protein A2X45_06315 [Lentisphaerae bacterium GWF2_50_93]HCE42082.1 FkbM family methyltransferase [Lentisphaeria bacterium]
MVILDILKFITSHPLNRHRKCAAVKDFFKWQLSSRLVPGEVIYHWVNDVKFVVFRGETGMTGNVYCGLYDYEGMGYTLHALRRDELFIDVGANVGSYTLLAAGAVGAKAYCFEPIKSTFDRLETNIHLNRLDSRVKCMNVGVGDENKSVRFTNQTNTINHVLADNENVLSEKTALVTIVSLDKILEAENPELLKVDVEGYETLVLRGAQNLLHKESLNSIIVELAGHGRRYGFDESAIIDMLYDLKYRPYIYDPISRELSLLERKNLKAQNTIYIKNIDLARERVSSAPKFICRGIPV